jgi:hypothetical protein
MRMSQRDGGQRPAFGKIDPFVWFPVFGLLVLTGVLIMGNAALWSPVPVLFAVGVVLGDARINRPPVGGSSRRSR